jgi:hypothetical protein
LTGKLLAQVERLLERLDGIGGLTEEQRIALAGLEVLCDKLDLRPAPERSPLPWVLRIEQI